MHLGLDAFRGERLGGGERLGQRAAVGDERDVRAGAPHLRPR